MGLIILVLIGGFFVLSMFTMSLDNELDKMQEKIQELERKLRK